MVDQLPARLAPHLSVALLALHLLGCAAEPAERPWRFVERRPAGADHNNDGIVRAFGRQGDEIDAVVADSEVEVAGLGPNEVAYNPSMVSWGEGALVVFRRDINGGQPDMRLGVMALDANFAPVGQPTYLDLRPSADGLHTAEDPRLVWHEDELYVVFNQRLQSATYFPRCMFLARIGSLPAADAYFEEARAAEQSGRPCRLEVEVTLLKRLVPPPPIAFRTVEKNWTPFSQGHELKLLYYSNPPVIFQIDREQLASREPVLVPHGPLEGAGAITYDFGEIRGGTGAALLGEWLGSPNTVAPSMGAFDGVRALGLFFAPPNQRRHWREAEEGALVWQPTGSQNSSGLALNGNATGSDPNALFEAFFHAQRHDDYRGTRRVNYTMGYYTFSARPPHQIVRYLPAPLLVPAAQELKDQRALRLLCSYPGGFVRRGRSYFVIYGHQDVAIRVLELDAEAVHSMTVLAGI